MTPNQFPDTKRRPKPVNHRRLHQLNQLMDFLAEATVVATLAVVVYVAVTIF